MLEFKQIDVQETPYLYEERTCSMDPADVGKTMGEAFHNVLAFLNANQIETTGQALSVYYTYDPEVMTFRAGFSVSEDDLAKAKGTVRADKTPAGKVLTFTHVGPYTGLRDSYGKLMEYIAANGLNLGAPTWEVYVNSPEEVDESELRTDIFATLN